MQPVTWNANYDYPPAYAGMIADSGFTDKVTVPCGATAQPYGSVVASVTATGVSVLPIGTNVPEGVAIHDHRGGARLVGNGDNYLQGDAMSVMRRGRIWGRASGTCTKDAVAKYDPATGLFSDAGTATLPNAKFLTANLSVPGIDTGSQIIVQVELHSPAVA
jgi:hypothetical protein